MGPCGSAWKPLRFAGACHRIRDGCATGRRSDYRLQTEWTMNRLFCSSPNQHLTEVLKKRFGDPAIPIPVSASPSFQTLSKSLEWRLVIPSPSLASVSSESLLWTPRAEFLSGDYITVAAGRVEPAGKYGVAWGFIDEITAIGLWTVILGTHTPPDALGWFTWAVPPPPREETLWGPVYERDGTRASRENWSFFSRGPGPIFGTS